MSIHLSKHLPPSAGRPRVLTVDAEAAARLRAEDPDAALIGPARLRYDPAALPFRPESFDALVACPAAPDLRLPPLARLLRPGARLLVCAPRAGRAALLAGLAAAGFVHLYAEDEGCETLVRGECPPRAARTVDRARALAGPASGGLRPVDVRQGDLPGQGRYLHLLVAQSPNKPAWRLAPGEQVTWRAAVGLAPDRPPAAPAFTSLVKAVAFMQAAVLAGALQGVNKMGRFPKAAARAWPFALVLDPGFEAWQAGPWSAGWRWETVDAGDAVLGE